MSLLKKIMITLLLGINFSSNSHAQSQEEMRKQIEEIMKARDEMFRSLFDDSGFGHSGMDQRMEEMIKRFDNWPNFGDEQMDLGSSFSDSSWTQTNTHRVLTIKVKQIKDRPLDIKINNGMITLKGDTELEMGGRKSIMKFERSFSIPKDVDEANPEFGNLSDQIIIKFKFKNLSKAPSKQNKSGDKAPLKTPAPDPKNERIPIGPDDSGLSL